MTTAVLPFTPAASPFFERFAWDTDLTPSVDGSESVRRRKRAYPRIEYELTLEEYEAYNAGLLSTQRARPDLYLLPLWPLAIPPSTPPVAGVSMDPNQVYFFAKTDGTYTAVVPQNGYDVPVSLPLPAPPNQYPRLAPTLPPGGVTSVVPTAPCVVDKTTSIRHPVAGFRQVQLRLRAVGFRECPIPYTSPLDSGLPVLPANWLEFTDAPTESFDRNENSLDAGAQSLIDLRYTERTFGAVVALTEPADQLAYRAFLFAIAGRFGAFRMQHPMDNQMRTWRLMSDAVELAWMPGGYVVSKLNFKELQ